MEKLPKEVLVHILSFLDIKDLVQCSKINRYWYDITNTNWVWKRFCNDLDGEYLKEYQEARDQQCRLQHACYWKWCYDNYERIKQNWIRKKYKKYEIELDGPRGNYKMATYDGSTLVIGYTNCVRVIKIAEGNLHDLQTIYVSESMLVLLNSISTNTFYIVLNCGKVIAVYKLVDDRYEGACMLYKKQSQHLKHASINQEIFSKRIVKSFYSGNICCIGSVIQVNTLYIYVEKKIYIWDLLRMECQAEIEAISFLVAQDGKNIYICPDHHTIQAYNNNSQSFLSLNTIWRISQIETNKELLLALEKDNCTWDEASSRSVCAWNKNSGVKLYEICLPLPDFYFLHPRWNILLGNICSGDNICAISPKDNTLLWTRLTRRKGNPFTNRILATGFRNLAANRFIITMVCSSTSYHMLDSKTGKSFYTFGNSEVKYVGFDVLLHTDSFRKNLVVRIYS